MKQKIFIKTFGCQMNEYDSDRIYDSVKKIGFQKTDNYEDADCYLLNTCHIRDKAKEKVYHEIGRVKKFFRSKQKPLVIITGCVAQAENEEMLRREPYIDFVIGPQSYHKINNSILNYIEKQKKILNAMYEVLITFSGMMIKKDYKDYTKEQMDSVVLETIIMFEQGYASDMSENYINTGKQMTDELVYEYQICNSVYQDIAESFQ